MPTSLSARLASLLTCYSVQRCMVPPGTYCTGNRASRRNRRKQRRRLRALQFRARLKGPGVRAPRMAMPSRTPQDLPTPGADGSKKPVAAAQREAKGSPQPRDLIEAIRSLVEILLLVGLDRDIALGVGHARQHKACRLLVVVLRARAGADAACQLTLLQRHRASQRDGPSTCRARHTSAFWIAGR